MSSASVVPAPVTAFWFRLPDDEQALMSLTHAQLKCYVVISRAIQRDKNLGKLSIRQIAQHANLNPKHAHAAVTSLIQSKRINCDTRPGCVSVYSLPFEWNRTPVGEQFIERGAIPTQEQFANKAGTAEPSLSPTGTQNCTPVGEQHLEYSEKTKPSSPARAGSSTSSRSGSCGARRRRRSSCRPGRSSSPGRAWRPARGRRRTGSASPFPSS